LLSQQVYWLLGSVILEESQKIQMNLKQLAESRIVIDADICSGKPRIKGTRVTVADILLALSEGMDEVDILRNFRSLRKEDIRAALAYAYCLSDNIKLNLKSAISDEITEIENDPLSRELYDEEARKVFSATLEAQALIQEELTKEKISQIREEKAKTAQPKAKAPEIKLYDLIIDIPESETIRIFTPKDAHEQKLKMDYQTYIFLQREDDQSWLTYSIKDGVEIDKAMRRSLKVSYSDPRTQERVEGIFEGYLTTDRLHKVFLYKDDKGRVFGRAL
jgi:uncharacterized protein (DUF433 family)